MEDRIPEGLQHHHKTYCEKGGHCGMWACMFLEMTLPWRCNFQTGGLVYDTSELLLNL